MSRGDWGLVALAAGCAVIAALVVMIPPYDPADYPCKEEVLSWRSTYTCRHPEHRLVVDGEHTLCRCGGER